MSSFNNLNPKFCLWTLYMKTKLMGYKQKKPVRTSHRRSNLLIHSEQCWFFLFIQFLWAIHLNGPFGTHLCRNRLSGLRLIHSHNVNELLFLRSTDFVVVRLLVFLVGLCLLTEDCLTWSQTGTSPERRETGSTVHHVT